MIKQPLKNKTMWTQSPAVGISWNYTDDVKSALLFLEEELYGELQGVDEVFDGVKKKIRESFPDLFPEVKHEV